MVPYELSDDDVPRRMANAARQFQQRLVALDQEKTQQLHEAEQLDHELESQEINATARAFLAEQLGEQPALASMPGHIEVNNTISTAQRFVTAAPKPWLRRWKIAAWIGTVVMAGVDVLAAWHVTGQMTTNLYGINDGSTLERGGLASLTLVGYWLLGAIYAWGGWWRRGAVAMYGVIVTLLTWGLAPVWVPKLQEILSSTSSVFGAQETTASSLVLAGAWAGTVIIACLFSFAGLLFLLMKHWLLSWIDLDHQHDVCRDILAKTDRASAARLRAQQIAETQRYALQHQAELIAEAAHDDQERDAEEARQRHDAAAQALNNIRTSAAKRREAENIRLASERFLDSLSRQTIMPCLLLGAALLGLTGCGTANSAPDLEAKAPVAQILADCSTSSPLYEKAFVDSVMRSVVTPKLLALPMASRVIVTCIGDSSKTPMSYDGRVQAINNRQGGTRQRLAQEVHRLLQSVPPATKYSRSELMFGFTEAAKKINPDATQPNLVLALSDLIEQSALADCSPQVKPKRFCHLPAPAFTFDNTEVIVLGVAVGLPADKAFLVNDAWKNWFLKTGIPPQRLVLQRD